MGVNRVKKYKYMGVNNNDFTIFYKKYNKEKGSNYHHFGATSVPLKLNIK
jgi:hypothetical protein